jgi:hypothetical protein
MPEVNEQQVSAGNGGKPVVSQQQPLPGGRQQPLPQPKQQHPVSTQAHWTAEDIERIADEADALGRLYRAECQRIAEDYRKITRDYLNRLIQLKQ